MRKFLLALLLFAVPAMAQTLSLVRTGSGNTETVTVTSSGQFKLRWSARGNWGLDGWWDLINDPTATTNLASPVYGINGDLCSAEDGLVQWVFYSEHDEKQFFGQVADGCLYPTTPRTMTVITNTAGLVVLRSTAIPVAPSYVSSILSTVTMYYIYPNGKIYVRNTVTPNAPFIMGKDPANNWGNDMVMVAALPNAYANGTIPDSPTMGWTRATYNQNPYEYTNESSPYVYTYWPASSGAFGYGSSMVPKASLMIVPNPNNTVTNVKQAIHTWTCGTGCGVTRWGYFVGSTQYLAAGQSLTYEWLLQLGTNGSGVLPDMTTTPPANCSTCTTIANAYIADPAPPGAAGLLSGMTPNNYVIPAGYTLHAAVDFENGTFGGSGAYGNGNFVTDQYHADGNAGHNHSIECQIGTDDGCGANVSWTRPLPVGAKEVYVSFWEYLSPTFTMNDEFFLARFWWNTGTGQPTFHEAIFDYFQNSTGDYNSTNATLLWNMQGQPYYQNKLPTNTRGGNTNFAFTLGSWVQHELYAKYSTTASAVSVGSSVTMNKAARTYTCSVCNWTALGVHVGDSVHFTGFANGYNNGDGAGGGGGSSYFVKSMTNTVLTMDDEALVYADATDTAANPTIQIDHGDGAYRYLKNGVEVAHQNNAVFPGKVDFSTQATNLSIGESYTHLTWRAPISKSDPNCVGDCQIDGCERRAAAFGGNGTGTFIGACQSKIGGGMCGYETLPYGWDASGHTRSTPGGAFDTLIGCSAAAGGPMPNPTVAKRYLDDIIVLYNTTGTAGGGSGVGGGGYQAPGTQPPSIHSGIRLIRH